MIVKKKNDRRVLKMSRTTATTKKYPPSVRREKQETSSNSKNGDVFQTREGAWFVSKMKKRHGLKICLLPNYFTRAVLLSRSVYEKGYENMTWTAKKHMLRAHMSGWCSQKKNAAMKWILVSTMTTAA